MKFISTRPSFVDGKYIIADVRNPAVIDLPDGAPLDHISRTWKPVDKKAQAALAKVGVKASLTTVDEVADTPAAPPSPSESSDKTAGEI